MSPTTGAGDIRFFQEDGRRNKERFAALIGPLLWPGMRILDVGAGGDPTLPESIRPAGTYYVGIDEDAAELERAAHRYDATIVSDITRHDPALDEQFDLVVSWQVFEHVRSPRLAYDNIHRYLKPGGMYGGRLTARNAWFAILNRLLPISFTRWLLGKASGRCPDSVFKAYYQDATIARLRAIFGEWASHEIWVEYDGREYFQFSRLATDAYLRLLRIVRRRPRFATYYTILARKSGKPGQAPRS